MHSMIRDANVEVEVVETKKGPSALITVNDEFQHQFPHKSRISQQLQLLQPKELAARLTGGSYFFVDEKLVDFRDQRYDGFVHDDAAIDNLMEVIGVTPLTTRHEKSRHRMTNRTQSTDLVLAKRWSRQEIMVPDTRIGGDFWSDLSFTWNPFAKNVATAYELVRLICSNGMVGTTPFVNMNIPLINRWEEHLEMANMQLQNKVTGMMAGRLLEMQHHRASVADTLLLMRHITDRVTEGSAEDQLALKLHRMYKIVDPFEHLQPYYKPEVLTNNAIAHQCPSHLSAYDAWNIATELCTHHEPSARSSDAGLQKFANDLVFRKQCSTDRARQIGGNIELSPFSSAERAFFGDVEVI